MNPPPSSGVEPGGRDDDPPSIDDGRAKHAHPLRRKILSYCATVSDRVMEVEDLVDHLLGERGRSTDVVERESIEVKLHHHHLPKLADEDVIEFDPASGQFRYRPDDRVERRTHGEALDPAPSSNRSTEAAPERRRPTATPAGGPLDRGVGPSAGAQQPDRLPLDVVYDLLSVARRRRVLTYLREEADTTTLGTLAEHLAAIECEKPVSALTSAERKRLYICLHQHHLPRMADAGVIDYDRDRGTVELAANADQLVRFLPGREEETTAVGHSRTALVLALLGGGVLLVQQALYPELWLSAFVVGSLVVLWYIAG